LCTTARSWLSECPGGKLLGESADLGGRLDFSQFMLSFILV